MRLLWLPGKLRAWLEPAGYAVRELEGWQRRGAELPARPLVVIGHHTATPASARGNFPTLELLRDGREDLEGPLCHVGIARDGTAWVIASGKANHAGPGRWRGLPGGPDYDVTVSSRTVGIEVEHPGGRGWTARQRRSFDLVAAALLDGLDAPAEAYCGHREWALPKGRKVDPGGIDLAAQRRRLAGLLGAGPTREEFVMASKDEVRAIVRAELDEAVGRISGGVRRRDAEGRVIDPDKAHVSTADVVTALEQLGDRLVAEFRAAREG